MEGPHRRRAGAPWRTAHGSSAPQAPPYDAPMRPVAARILDAFQLTRLSLAFGSVCELWLVTLLTRADPRYVHLPIYSMPLWKALLSTAMVAIGLFAFAASLNDLLDLRHDRRFSPERPLAAGRIRTSSAAVLSFGALMLAVVAASTLGNYIPMQAGSLGRIAYHKAVNRIDVRASIVAMLQATVLTFVCVCVLGAGALVAKAASAPWWCVLPVPLLWLPLAIEPGLRTYALVAFVRSIEILVWALHAWAAFRISGWPIEPETAIGVSLVGSAANLVPFMGNGLGVREWAVALAAPILGGYERDAGLAAELMGRAFDVVVAIPLGLAGVGALVRRARAVEQRAAHARAAPHAQ